MKSRHRIAAFALALVTVPLPLWSDSARKVTKLADGIYSIEHQTLPSSGNTTVIIGDRQVLVVDTCFLPSAAREDIADIRKWTDKPVVFIVNTHFHNDHNLGNRAYLDAFPAATIIATTATQKSMEMFGPTSAERFNAEMARLQRFIDSGKGPDGNPLTAEDKAQVQQAIERRTPAVQELHDLKFQGATLAFDHDFTIDLGNREVQIKYLGRGNTNGDAIAFLPKEKIVIAGDLVVFPVPYIYDGYPSEWVTTLDHLAALDWQTLVPGHGPVLHDKQYVLLERNLLRSALDQLDAELLRNGPALSQDLKQVKSAVDLSAYRVKFAGDDPNAAAEFDDMVGNLVRLMFYEASLR